MEQEREGKPPIDKVVEPYIKNCFDKVSYLENASKLLQKLVEFSEYLYGGKTDVEATRKLRKECRGLVEESNRWDQLRGRSQIILRDDEEAIKGDGENKRLFDLDMIEHCARDYHAVGNSTIRLDEKLRGVIADKIKSVKEKDADFNLFDIYHEAVVNLYRKHVK